MAIPTRTREAIGNLPPSVTGFPVEFLIDPSDGDPFFYITGPNGMYEGFGINLIALLSTSGQMAYKDNDVLAFGDDADVGISWDTDSLNFIPLVHDTGSVEFGNGTKDIRVKMFLGSVSEYAEFDVTNSRVNLVGIPVLLTPVSTQAVGYQVVSQCVQAFKYECNITAQQGAWVHGMKVELTRVGNIMPATGCWFGAQFVLNAGTGTALDKDAYVLQCVFKGSGTSPDGVDIHVGRFETQSAGKVSDIVHILANTGCTVIGHLLYLASHINADGALINVQSAATMAKGLSFMAGAGATLTSLLYASGDGTFTNLLEVSASGKGGVVVGSMNKDPKTQAPDAFLRVKVGAVTYEGPLYAAA